MTINRLHNALSENFDLNNQTQLLVILTKVQVPPVSTVYARDTPHVSMIR